MEEKKVEIYTSPSCHYCHSVKELFEEKGIKYTEYDIQADASKREEVVQKSGQLGVPLVIIDDKDMVVGFDEPKLAELLGY